MQIEAHLDAETMKRLKKQGRMLLKTYETEFAKDPGSPATESSRSNMMALRHTINQIYGEAVALEVSDSLGSRAECSPTNRQAG